LTSNETKILIVGGPTAAIGDALRTCVENALIDAALSADAALEHLRELALSGRETPLYDVAIVDDAAAGIVTHLAEILPTAPIVVVGSAVARLDPLKDGVVARTPDLLAYLPEIVRLHVARQRLHAEIHRQRRELEELAARDELTGLFNRRRFNEALELETERSLRFHRPVTLLLVDLDNLKGINDTHGHMGGDAALRHVAFCLRQETRRFETAARLGGDEFAVLLVDTNFDVGRQVAEKLRRAVTETQIATVGAVSISTGVASMPAHADSAAELVHVADQALYEAKGLGRNRVVVSREALQQREGDRHPIRFRIVIRGRNNSGERFTEETETELVSRRGARLLSSHAVASGETIELSTPFHSRALTATVTACYRGADNRMRIGFKLVDPPRWGA
jgi:diguanylate cyclase (GGDEF)-like protein